MERISQMSRRSYGPGRCLAALSVALILGQFVAAPVFSQTMESEVPTPSIDLTMLNQPSTKATVRLGPSQGLTLRQLPMPSEKSIKTGPGFEGFGFDDNAVENNGFLYIPPDAIGAAGKSRVIAVVNTMIEARNKGGALKWRDSLRDFFAPLSPQTSTFDPKVIYDNYEDRFLIVSLEVVAAGAPVTPENVSRLLLAVSKNGNPKGPTAADWYYHAIDSKVLFGGFVELWADYPGFEADEEAVYITSNLFAFPPFSGYGGMRLWIVDKGAGSGGFYDGGPASVSINDPYSASGLAGFDTTTMPAQVYGKGGVGGPGSTLGTFLFSYSGLTFGGLNQPEALIVITVDDPLGANGGPYFIGEFVVVGDIEDVGGGLGWPPLPDAPQAGTATLIEVNDRRALDAVWRNDSLWCTTTINPNTSVDEGETTAHWFKIGTQGGPGALYLDDEGNIGGEDIATGTYTFFPSVAVNRRGSAMFGFSGSAPTIFAGAYVTGRTVSDPLTTVQESETVMAGVDFYIRTFGGSRNRWGDYSGISIDPTNEDFVWVFNQFADMRGTAFGGEDGRWGTAWKRAKFKGKK